MMHQEEVCAPAQTSGVKKTLSSVFFTLPTTPPVRAETFAASQRLGYSVSTNLRMAGRDRSTFSVSTQ
jgi:hypothetical protein